MQADIAALEAAISRQSSGVGDHVAANAAIDDAIERGQEVVTKLDALVKNKYASNPPVRAEWRSASHTERAPRRKKPTDQQTNQPQRKLIGNEDELDVEIYQEHRQGMDPDDVKQLKQLARENIATRFNGLKLGRTSGSVRTQAANEKVSLKPANQSPYNRAKQERLSLQNVLSVAQIGHAPANEVPRAGLLPLDCCLIKRITHRGAKDPNQVISRSEAASTIYGK